MYEAKAHGRARHAVFDPTMHVRAVTRLAIETDLRRAIDNDQLELHYQPIKWSKGDRIVGVEALVRWRRPDGALVLPGEFVPVAEETGLIRPIGRWVLHAAMDDFGTGSSSLSSLSQLPLDILKIDQSFVARLDQDPEGRAIVYAIISLATALGVRVTGEGIETATQLATLIELRCEHGQGFLLGRPAPPDELAALLRTVDTTEVTVARLARLQ
jgi:EAL domain-containing protein (putative c-di-GMP-specific phosphodiesterase class I)